MMDGRDVSGAFVDYAYPPLAEIVARQADIIERQGERIVELGAANLELRERAELSMREEHRRYVEILILVENGFHAHRLGGNRWVDAGALVGVLRDVFEYAEDGKEPDWFEGAVRAMGGGL